MMSLRKSHATNVVLYACIQRLTTLSYYVCETLSLVHRCTHIGACVPCKKSQAAALSMHGPCTPASRPNQPLLPRHPCICLTKPGLGSARPYHSRSATTCILRLHLHAPAYSSDNRRVASSGLGGILAILCLVGSLPAEAAQQVVEGPARVIDGDTLEVSGERIRLFGLDAPEKAQLCDDKDSRPYACGMRSKEALERKIGGMPVRCSVRAKDLYGRSVSKCSAPGVKDIGHWLVHNGYAIAYRQYSKAYVPDEEAAHQAKQGMWKGTFQAPADWRREHKRARAAAQPDISGPSLTSDQETLLKTIRDRLLQLNKMEAHKSGCDM